MSNDTIVEWITGTVKQANDNGFKLEGREGWCNASKYAEPPPIIPAKGTRVDVGLDKSGYVREVRRASAEPAAAPVTPHTSYDSDARDQRISRLAVMNTATTLLGGGPGYPLDPAAVLETAAVLLAWANGQPAAAPAPAAAAARPPRQDPEDLPWGDDGPAPAAPPATFADFTAAVQRYGYENRTKLAAVLGMEGGWQGTRAWTEAGHTWTEAIALLKAAAAQRDAAGTPA